MQCKVLRVDQFACLVPMCLYLVEKCRPLDCLLVGPDKHVTTLLPWHLCGVVNQIELRWFGCDVSFHEGLKVGVRRTNRTARRKGSNRKVLKYADQPDRIICRSASSNEDDPPTPAARRPHHPLPLTIHLAAAHPHSNRHPSSSMRDCETQPRLRHLQPQSNQPRLGASDETRRHPDRPPRARRHELLEQRPPAR